MEDGKKRKKNKKKKNNQCDQSKAKEDTAVFAEEKISPDQNHSPDQDATSLISEKTFAPDNNSGNLSGENGDLLVSGAERSGQSTNDRDALVIAENEKKHWQQREASLEEMIDQLKAEKDTHMRKGFRLEMRVVELEHEKESLLLKQASLEETISQLVSEKSSVIAMQVEFQERIKHLERDKDSWVSKEAQLEEKIKSLEMDNESWNSKQSLLEEMIGNLRDANTRLLNQVEELEESKIRALQENQMLLVNMSGLQVQLQNRETLSADNRSENSEICVLNSQIEAASNLIEKLVMENADLVEKVNQLYIELDRRGTQSKIASTLVAMPDISLGIDDGTVPNNAQEFNEPLEIDKTEFAKLYPMEAVSNGEHDGKLDHSAVADATITTDSGEIVQIPLSESESQDAAGQQTADEDEDSPVELSDAPLTGAPIRFISFVARYVSGADLVNKNPTNVSK